MRFGHPTLRSDPRPPGRPPRRAPPTLPAAVLRLQRAAGNRATSALVQRAVTGLAPGDLYDDWRTAVGPMHIGHSLNRWAFEQTTHSDQGLTFEDEVEAALDLTVDYLTNPQRDGSNLLIWQKQVRTSFQWFRREVSRPVDPNDPVDWTRAIQRLDDAFRLTAKINALPQAPPQFDVTWKRQVVPGRITLRNVGTRVEALFEVQPGGSPRSDKKNLNVSLRRHWWNGITAASVANPAGNSIIGPGVGAQTILADIEEVAKQYIATVTQRGYAAEFGVDAPSGAHYHVNRLDNQQPHCFPNRGTGVVSLSPAEYTAAVQLKVGHEAHTSNRNVAWVNIRNALRAAPTVLDRLKRLGIGFAPDFLKQVA